MRSLALFAIALAACQPSASQVSAGDIQGIAVETSGAAAVGATVTMAEAAATTTTDSAGRFRLSGLPAGTYTIIFQSGSSGLRLADVVLAQGSSGGGLGLGVDLGTIALGATGSIEGTVDLTGTNVTTVSAILTGVLEVSVPLTGLFTINGLLPGNYDLFVVGTTSQFTTWIAGPISVHVAPNIQTLVNAISLGVSGVTMGTLSGRVGLSGQSSSNGVSVQFTDPDGGTVIAQTMTTDQNGDYQALNVPAGVGTVTASFSGFGTVSVPLVPVAGVSTAPFIALLPSADAGP